MNRIYILSAILILMYGSFHAETRIEAVDDFEINTNYLGEVFLEWENKTEVSSELYSIERSSDGETWWKIGEVHPLNKQSLVSMHYSFLDQQPMNGVSFYRVKSTIVGGDRVNTKPKMVYLENDKDLKIIPDSKKKEINIYMKGSIIKDVQLFGPSGMPIQVDYLKEPYAGKIDSKKLNPGKYNLSLITDNQTINRQIIII
ncbi:MAG: hypothetical protein AAF487_08760 [Bacteroidota bacterium]